MIEPLCVEVEEDLWFSPKAADKARAIEICGRCNEKDACLTIALEQNMEYGIWGGTTPDERKKQWMET